MARHRDIRNMDYSEDYDGYDDVYGHSVDDDFYISPSNRQFLYNREHSQRSSEGDIKEEDESEAELSDLDRTKLVSCIDQIKQTLGSISISRNDLVNIIIQQRFDLEKSMNIILEGSVNKSTGIDYNKQNENRILSQLSNLYVAPQTNESKHQFEVPNIFNKSSEKPKFNIPNLYNDNKPKFTIPNLHSGDVGQKPKFTIPKLQRNGVINKNDPKLIPTEKPINLGTVGDDDQKQFDNLSDLVSNHLKSNSIDTPLTNIKSQILHLDSIKVSEITPKIAKMNISESKSFSAVSSNQNEFQIDLSVALKNTGSAPVVRTTNKGKEMFEIPFIDCEQEILTQKEVTKESLLCSLNVYNFSHLNLNLEKRKSMFGRVVCKRFKRYVAHMLQDSSHLNNIRRFDFSTVSPDSQIIDYLKKWQ